VPPPQTSEVLIEKIEPIDLPKLESADAEPTESTATEATHAMTHAVEK